MNGLSLSGDEHATAGHQEGYQTSSAETYISDWTEEEENAQGNFKSLLWHESGIKIAYLLLCSYVLLFNFRVVLQQAAYNC